MSKTETNGVSKTAVAKPAEKPISDPKYREGFRDGFRRAAQLIAQEVGRMEPADKERLSRGLERLDIELAAMDKRVDGG